MVLTLNIDDGTNNVDVYFTYRWWVPGNDPWRAAVPGYFGNDSGDYAYAGIGGVGSFQVNDSNGNWVATLQSIPTNGTSLNMTVGASGNGLHNITGQQIGSVFQWTCTNIS